MQMKRLLINLTCNPCAGFSWASPTKVEADMSFLFTESSLVLKIKCTWLIFIITLYSYITLFHCSTQLQSRTIATIFTGFQKQQLQDVGVGYGEI